MMMKCIVLVSFLAVSLASPFADPFGPDCFKNRMDAIKKFDIPAGYVKQAERMMQCDGPQFYYDCYEKNMGQKLPRSLEQAVNMTCQRPDIEKSQKFLACVMNSTESVLTAGSQMFSNVWCQIQTLSSNEEGFLCHQYQTVGAEKATEFVSKYVDNQLTMAGQYLALMAPQDMKPCAALVPTNAAQVVDMMCGSADDENGRGNKLSKCLEEHTTVRAAIEIATKLKPKFG